MTGRAQAGQVELEGTSAVDGAPIARVPWLTHRRLVGFVIGWIALFASVSVFVSNPFQSETSAGAAPNYWHVMFLHGLLISMVGLGALLACQVLRLRSTHMRVWIAAGVLAATVLTAVGGLWDKKIPGDEVPLWTQIAGFFALDEILLALLLGIVIEWRRRSSGARTLPFLAAGVAAASMFVAAVMGHLAGWILEFGNSPGLIDRYARFVGESRTDWANNLIASHSHEMVVAMMALLSRSPRRSSAPAAWSRCRACSPALGWRRLPAARSRCRGSTSLPASPPGLRRLG
jgi:hypothetical protein